MNKVLVFIVLLLIVGGGYVFINSQKEQEMPPVSVIPTQSAIPMKTDSVKKFTLDSFEFGYDQKILTVNEGDTVTILLTNSGKMPHDWIVDEFTGAKTKQIKNGETDTITFIADKAGEYEFYCSVGAHRANGMVGKLIVE